MTYIEKLSSCVKSIRTKTDFVPKAAIILGSGLGDFANSINQIAVVKYSDIEGFPQSTVIGHAGQFVFGYHGNLPVVIMQGRVHYYEGYPMDDVVLPVRLMKLLGAQTLLLTNAAGGINSEFSVGDLMMITDHISSFVPSPLIGENLDKLGTRFPDMSNIYDQALQQKILLTAKEQKINIRQGVYLQFTGPQYESPAEINMAKLLGADAVGMSTACEAIAANHMSMKIAGISCITNMASGLSKAPLNHKEVQEAADLSAQAFKSLVSGFLNQLEV